MAMTDSRLYTITNISGARLVLGEPAGTLEPGDVVKLFTSWYRIQTNASLMAAQSAAQVAITAIDAPTGTATPEPAKFFANHYQKLITIYEKYIPVIPAEPDVTFLDDEINLGVYCRFADTDHLLISWAIEKQDETGAWVATNGGPNYDRVWDFPEAEPDGYEVLMNFVRGPKDRPFCPPERKPLTEDDNPDTLCVGTDTGRDVNGPSFTGDWSLGDGIQVGESRVRVRAKRSSRVYSPEEQAAIDALGPRRIRVLIQTKNFCLWEKQVPITGDHGSYLIFEEIDVSDYGLTGEADTHVWVVEFRRNGKTIRGFIQREYREGEEFDPPSLPVSIIIVPRTPVAPWYGGSDAGELWEPHRYGRWHNPKVTGPGDQIVHYPDLVPLCDGVWLGNNQGYCNGTNVQKTVIAVRRWGDPLTTYRNGSGYTPGTLDLTTFNPDITVTFETKPGIDYGTTLSIVEDGTNGGSASVDARQMVTVRIEPGVTTLDQLAQLVTDAAPMCPLKVTSVSNGGYVIQPGTFKLVAWESGSYFNIPAGTFAQVPVPPGSTDNCTVRVRLMAAPDALKGKQYPWMGSSYFGGDTEPLRLPFP